MELLWVAGRLLVGIFLRMKTSFFRERRWDVVIAGSCLSV
jgi:hypothetical protein